MLISFFGKQNVIKQLQYYSFIIVHPIITWKYIQWRRKQYILTFKISSLNLFVCQIYKLSWSILHCWYWIYWLALSDDCNSIKRALPTDLFGWQIFPLEGFGSLIELICNKKWKCIDFWHQYSLFPEVRLNLDVLWCIPTMHSTQCPYNWDFDGLDSK